MKRLLTILLLVSAQSFSQQIAWNSYELNSTFYNGFKLAAEIGKIEVKENRNNANSNNKVELAMVRLKSTHAKPSFPIIFLAGGPGNSGIEAARGEMLPIFLKLREVADVIVLDQRGTGQSKPSLAFPEGKFALPLDKTLNSPESMKILKESAENWATALQKKGIDIGAYNTAENAEDLEEIRKALGVEKITLWGFSYGTHLGLAYLKKYEKNAHKVILGGINALDDRYRLPTDGDETIRKIGELVKQTPKLSQAIPDLYGLTQQVLADLEKQPISVNKLPFSDQKINIVVGKLDLQVALTTISAQTWFPKDFPAFVLNMTQNKTAFAGFYVRENIKNPRSNLSTAMAFSAHCASGASVERLQLIETQSKSSIFGNAINFPFMAMDFCSIWGVNDLGEAFRTPVVSEVPTLIMNGDLDGRTSIEQAKEVANGFKNGKFITIKNASHNFWMVSPEIPDAMFAFLNGQPVEKSVIEDPLFEFRSPFEDELTEQLYSSTHADNLTFEKAYNDLLNGSKYLNSSVLANLANRLNRENKTDKAMMVLLFAVRQYPKNWRFHQALGEAYQRQGNNEMAKKSFETVLMLNPYGLRASQAINYK